MAWNKKTWQDRVSEYPNRRRLDDTGVPNTYDIARDEGNVMVEGDAFNAETMNDFETRIDDGFNDIRNRTINGKPLTSDISLTPSDIGALPSNAISSGNNTNGSWIQFPDGTMICYGYVRITQTTPSEGTSTYTITFPQTFEGTPCPQITILDDSAVVYTIQIRRTTRTEMLIQIYNSSKYDSGGTGISWSAFGRWE